MKAIVKYFAMGVVRLVLSLTFLFSGVVKLIDPRGTQYKIEDYSAAFGFGGLLSDGMALALACLLAVAEFLIAIHLLFGMRRQLVSSLAICFLLVMTPLTLYLALNNPVSDCGCFGDALVLSNWQTFGKNVVLLILAIIALRFYTWMPRLVTRNSEWMVALYSFVFACLFMGYNLWRLPVIDFRPYHLGADIRKAWYDDQQDFGQFVTTFIMEKDGVQQEFALEDYPDSTWTLIDTRTIQTEPSKRSGVGDLIIQDAESGEDLTEQILGDEGYTFLLLAPYLEKADDSVMGGLLTLYDFSREAGYGFYCLTSSGEKGIESWKEMTGAEYPFCQTDAVVLKTMIRSNPGLMLLHDGKVVGKWPSSGLPMPEEIETLSSSYVEGTNSLHGSWLERGLGILCWYTLPLLLILLIDAISVAVNREVKGVKKDK